MTRTRTLANARAPLGSRIRAARRRQGITLAQLAETMGIDKGFLSRLERGEKTAAIGTIQSAARALGQSMAQLLGEEHDPREVHLVRAAQRPRFAPAGLGQAHGIESLLLGDHGTAFSAYVVTVQAEAARVVAHHAGQELLYVLRGRVCVAFGARQEELAAGDCVSFPGYLPHSLCRVGRAPAQVLVFISTA